MTDAVNSLEMGPPADVASLTPQQARERLLHVTADPTWTSAYLSGSGPHVKEFDGLKARADEADAVDAVMAEANVPRPGGPNINGVSRADTANFVQQDRQAGIPAEYTARALRGERIDDAEFARHATDFRVQKYGNAEWRDRLGRGDATARRELDIWMRLVVAQKGRHAPTIMGRL